VNIDLHSVSDKPITLSVGRTSENVTKELTSFTDAFNEMVDKVNELTKFDPTTNERGLLMGESAVQSIQSEMYASLNAAVTSAGKYRTLSSIGLTLGDGGKLSFDEEKFKTAYGDDPQAVQNLFTTLDSTIADVKQCSLDSAADHILATLFLKRFTGDIPWIHVDLSASSSKGGLGAVSSDTTGFGVGWALELLAARIR